VRIQLGSSQRKYMDIVVIGAGPAGLATAIAARHAGFEVLLADHAVPPIDKACGEGIMPDGLAALSALGVTVPQEKAFAFRGIRFMEDATSVDAVFPHGQGFGLRRTVLHELLTQKASELGVQLRWGTRVSEIASDHVEMDGQRIDCRWIVGADGQASMVRQKFGIGRALLEQRRFGFRQHFAVKPWTDRVEVYWSDCGQVYVTPVAEDEVCVALITADLHCRLGEIATRFPELATRLRGSFPTTRAQGAITMTRQLDTVFKGNVALVGEASGSVDAITGEGLSLGFQQAVALVNAMRSGSLYSYDVAHREIGKNPRRMAKLMMLLGQRPWLRHRALRALASRPELFAQMLSVHVGESRVRDFGIERAVRFGWSMLNA
jgi:flavin-dependent dehydrogenase